MKLPAVCPLSSSQGTQPPEIVLKCRFYYYSGTVRPVCQEMAAIEKVVCTHSSHVGHVGKHQSQ